MIYQKHCPGCFENKNSLAVCPHCGYDESAPRTALYLPHGVIIGGQYRVGSVLGRPGGFGITYIAWDVHLQQRVAIKEYLPRRLAGRSETSTDVVVDSPEHEAAYREGLEDFLAEARVIARFDHPNIVRVRAFFRANNTAYLVMDYYEGISLGDYMATLREGHVSAEVAVRFLGPVLEGLQFVHDHGVIHRDIKPQNIYLASGGRAILLDFGAARDATRSADGGGLVLLSEGYAPLEQYQKEGRLGPWTDVYAVAATLYRMVTGKIPPAALDRVGDDAVMRPMGLDDVKFEQALRTGLALHIEDRFQSAYEFRIALFDALDILDDSRDTGEPAVTGTREVTTPVEPETVPLDVARSADRESPRAIPAAPWGSDRGAAMIAAAILIGAIVIAAVLWLRLPG